MQRAFYIPPGGVIGAQANTQAGSAALLGATRSAMRANGKRRRSKKRAASNGSARKSAKRATWKGKKLKKGSAAAKAWGRAMKRARGK